MGSQFIQLATIFFFMIAGTEQMHFPMQNTLQNGWNSANSMLANPMNHWQHVWAGNREAANPRPHHQTPEEEAEDGHRRKMGWLHLLLILPAQLHSLRLGIGTLVGGPSAGGNGDSHSNPFGSSANSLIECAPVYGQQTMCLAKIPAAHLDYMEKYGLLADLGGGNQTKGGENFQEIAQLDLSSCDRTDSHRASGRNQHKGHPAAHKKEVRKNLRQKGKPNKNDEENQVEKLEENEEENVCKKKVEISPAILAIIEQKLEGQMSPAWRQTHLKHVEQKIRMLKEEKKGEEDSGTFWGKRHLLQTGGKMTKFTVINNCDYNAWPNTISGDPRFSGGNRPASWDFPNIHPGQQATISIPSDTIAFNLQIQMACEDDGTKCTSGACKDTSGNSVVCPRGQQGSNPKTQAEWTLHGDGGIDYYDSSLVNGQNVAIKIVPIGGQNCAEVPGCNLLIAIADQLPANIVTRDPNGYAYLVSDLCDANPQDDAYCCRGAYGTADTCRPIYNSGKAKDVYAIEHAACPNEYLYAYDDVAGTKTCNMQSEAAPEYQLHLCPKSQK